MAGLRSTCYRTAVHVWEGRTVKVTIRVRALERPWGNGPNQPVIRTVEISDTCPKCGEKRGFPWPQYTYDDGEHYTVSRWNNSCGHIDLYTAVAREAGLVT